MTCSIPRICLVLLMLMQCLVAEPYRLALPGYRYQFPADHFAHPGFQTEWWYWTGNLFDSAGRRFGFELTFFRHNVRPTPAKGTWDIDDVFLAHLALTDVEGKKFFHTEKINRGGPGLAGISADSSAIWNGNWRVDWKTSDTGAVRQALRAFGEQLELQLDLVAAKPVVIHGQNGVSQKAEGIGKASHYLSFTRLNVSGKLNWQGKLHTVSGTAWMDHEFFTNQLGDQQVGWDWFAIQLENNEELMLYRLRRKDGSGDLTSSGTFVDSQGRARHLSANEFRLVPKGCWQSAASKGCYPLTWSIDVPSLGLKLESAPTLLDQELAGKASASPTYWEGAMDYSGVRAGRPIKGRGYLELTGYASAFSFESR